MPTHPSLRRTRETGCRPGEAGLGGAERAFSRSRSWSVGKKDRFLLRLAGRHAGLGKTGLGLGDGGKKKALYLLIDPPSKLSPCALGEGVPCRVGGESREEWEDGGQGVFGLHSA